MIEQRVTLRYDAQQIPAIVQAVQGDTGRDVIFELADYEIPAGATANYYIDKPDGNAVYNSAEVISSTEILAHLTEQALAVPGRNNGQVRILADGEVITSFDFVLEVEAFRGILRLQSETEVNIFDEALQEAAEDAIEEIQAQTPVVTGMQNSIAPSYSSSSTYAVGDYVMYNAQQYRCITAITTAEAWTAAHWTQVPLANDVNGLKKDLNATQNGILHDDLIDNFVLGNDGYAKTSAATVSYFDKVSSQEDAPFYPLPMAEWHPVSNLSATFRYGILYVPDELKDEEISIGFWFKATSVSSGDSVKFALWDGSSYVANFTRYVQSTLDVGVSQTVNGCIATVDAKTGDWYHVTIEVPSNKNLKQIWMGADYFVATNRIYWSMPVIIKGNLCWFIKYKNKYYPAKTTDYIDDILYGKKIGWFGDSIMLGRHNDEDYGWYNNLQSLGCYVDVKAVNGAMISVKGAGYHSIISETGSTVFDSDTDYLVFDGGANDYFNRQPVGTITESYSGSGLDTSTYIGAFEQICYNLLTNYPASKIGYIIPYKMETYADIQGQKQYFDNAIEVCKKWGVPYLDLRYMCPLNHNVSSLQQYFKDDVHIAKSGYQLTENIVAEWLRSI